MSDTSARATNNFLNPQKRNSAVMQNFFDETRVREIVSGILHPIIDDLKHKTSHIRFMDQILDAYKERFEAVEEDVESLRKRFEN